MNELQAARMREEEAALMRRFAQGAKREKVAGAEEEFTEADREWKAAKAALKKLEAKGG